MNGPCRCRGQRRHSKRTKRQADPPHVRGVLGGRGRGIERVRPGSRPRWRPVCRCPSMRVAPSMARPHACLARTVNTSKPAALSPARSPLSSGSTDRRGTARRSSIPRLPSGGARTWSYSAAALPLAALASTAIVADGLSYGEYSSLARGRRDRAVLRMATVHHRLCAVRAGVSCSSRIRWRRRGRPGSPLHRRRWRASAGGSEAGRRRR